MTRNGLLHSHSLPFLCSQFPLLPIHKFKPYFPFPRDYHRVIPIPIPFPNMHSKTISVHTNSRQSSNRKTVPQNTGHQSLKCKNYNNTIHNILKIRQKYFYSHPSKCCELWQNKAMVHKSVECFFSNGNRGSFPFPSTFILTPFHSHSQVLVLFTFFHVIPIPMLICNCY